MWIQDDVADGPVSDDLHTTLVLVGVSRGLGTILIA